MTPDHKKHASNAKSMSDLRAICSRNPDFKAAYAQSIEPVISLLNDRFGRMKLKESPLCTNPGASHQDIQTMFDEIQQIDDTLEMDKMTQKDQKKAEKWLKFKADHCKCSNYSFQIKKCTNVECTYCKNNPSQIPDFDSIHFLPDPEPDPTNKEHYLPFEKMYGKNTSDIFRPSLKEDNIEKEPDKAHRSLLVAARVRDYILCCECSKPRCIYSASKLSLFEKREIQHALDEGTYSCGMSLFLDSHCLRDTIVVREAICCSSLVEATYYSSQRVSFDFCCIHCGSSDHLYDGDEMRAKKEQYQTVRPICEPCKLSGR